MQIRSRLTIQFFLIAAGILLIAMLYIYVQFDRNLRDEFYVNLRSKAVMTAEMIAGKLQDYEQTKTWVSSDNESLLSSSYTENISIYDKDGRRIFSFNDVPDEVSLHTLDRIHGQGEYRFTHGRFDALGMLYSNREGLSYVVIAEAIFNKEYLYNLRNILMYVFLISIALIAAGGWAFSRQALAPVSQIMNQVDALLPSKMETRLESPSQNDELSRLVVTFNNMLDRIENAFQMQKMFISNISHELKNPLNVIIAQIEVTLDKVRDSTAYRSTLTSVLEDAKALDSVTDKLLQMARIHSSKSVIPLMPVRIDEIVLQVHEHLKKSNPEYRVTYELSSLPEYEEHLIVLADEHLLKTALINIIDNACKFNPGRQAHVRLSFDASDQAILDIEDDGPGIDQDDIPLIFTPFYRSPKAGSVKGSGIGLTLVDSIMKLHDIELSVESNPGYGSKFQLHFPASHKHEKDLELIQ